MSDALVRVLLDLSIVFILGGLGGIGLIGFGIGFYRSTDDRKSRRITFVISGIVILLITAYLVAAYLVTGPGRVLLR